MSTALASPLAPARPPHWRMYVSAAIRRPPVAVTALLMAALLCIAQSVLLSLEMPSINLPVNDREAEILFHGVHASEYDQRSWFRWSDGDTEIRLYPRAGGGPNLLVLSLGAPPPGLSGTPLQISAGGALIETWPLDAQPRRYQLLLPPQSPASPAITVNLKSATVMVPPDTRQVSARIEGVALRRASAGIVWPAPAAIVIQTLLLLLSGGLFRILLPQPWEAIGGALVGSLLAYAFAVQPFLYTPFVARLAVAFGLLLAATLIALGPLARATARLGPPAFGRAIWGVAMLACGVRLIGSLYPLFNAYDLSLNVDRFVNVAGGTLIALNESFEFQGGMTIYPPGAYLPLQIGLLFGIAPPLIVQIGIAVIDGVAVLLVPLLARRLGASTGASIIAGLLAAVMPISLTSLYYGHTAEMFGQALMPALGLLLMNALAQPRRTTYWAAAGVVLSIALVTHIGVMILAASWMGLLWLVLSVKWRGHGAAWPALTQVLIASAGIAILFVYAPVIGTHLAQVYKIGAGLSKPDSLPAYNLILKAYWIAYTPLGVLLFVPGLALLAQRMPREGQLLIGCWIAAAALFAAVELLSGLQVRFLVFLTPLVAIAAGAVLDSAAARWRSGSLIVLVVIALWCGQGGLAWYSGAFANQAPSMVPLLR